MSLLLQILGLRIINDSSLNILTSGPYGILFASFVPFYLDIPVSTRFRVFGLQFSDKTFIYGAGLQLLFSSWRRSLLPGICGILAGSFYRMNVLRIRRMKFPDFIASFFSRLALPSRGSTSPTATARNPLGSVPSFAGRQVEGNYPAPFPSTVDPPEDSIATLVSMGFDRNAARQALIRARNDVTAATNILLGSE
ncbi:OLC1v1036423C2 [Oldenlandia corymbosa var. corymbosa]|nr:OLC1v1036423C2 [Oldenlandia corymbosa var. corymbosa]